MAASQLVLESPRPVGPFARTFPTHPRYPRHATASGHDAALEQMDDPCLVLPLAINRPRHSPAGLLTYPGSKDTQPRPFVRLRTPRFLQSAKPSHNANRYPYPVKARPIVCEQDVCGSVRFL